MIFHIDLVKFTANKILYKNHSGIYFRLRMPKGIKKLQNRMIS